MSCWIAFVTSYLIESGAKILRNGDVHRAQIPDFEMERTIWRIEVSDGSFFFIFHALSFKHNFFFDRSFRLTLVYMGGGGQIYPQAVFLL